MNGRYCSEEEGEVSEKWVWRNKGRECSGITELRWQAHNGIDPISTMKLPYNNTNKLYEVSLCSVEQIKT